MPPPENKPKKKKIYSIENKELQEAIEELIACIKKKGKVTDLEELLRYAKETVPLEAEKEKNFDMKDKTKKPVKKKSLPTMWPNGLTTSLIVEGMIKSFPYQKTPTKEELEESAKRILREK